MKLPLKLAYVFVFCFVTFAVRSQTKEPTRDAKWLQDIEFYASELPARHKDLFFDLKKDEFLRAIGQLEKDVPTLDDGEIKVRLMTLTAKVGDPHTSIWDKLENIDVYPVKLRQFPEGWFVIAAAREYKEAVGKRLVRIGNVDIDDAAKRVRDVFAAQNQFGMKDRLAVFLKLPIVLRAKGITRTDTEADYVFACNDGKELSLRIRAQKYVEANRAKEATVFENVEIPLALRNADKNYWFEYLPPEKTLFVAHNHCRQDAAKSFADFAKELFRLVDRTQPDRIVVDLRRNEGGDSGVILPLYSELSKRRDLTRKGHLFVLLGRQTFSSGIMNAIEMREKFHAIWVGEPPAQGPVNYGEVKSFELPNSKMEVSYSTKKFVYDKNEKHDHLPVDIAVEETFADYAKGRDKALEAVFEYRNK